MTPSTTHSTAAPDDGSFHHPRANAQVSLGHTVVAYLLKRSPKRRCMSFHVGLEGLSVSVPLKTPLQEVHEALQSKALWVLSKLTAWRTRQSQQAGQVVRWQDGGSVMYLGQPLTLQLVPVTLHDTATRHPVQITSDAQQSLQIGLPPTAPPDHMRAMVQTWFKHQAMRLFQDRLNHFAPLLGVRWTEMALSSATTSWGNARANGSIRLNWRLMQFELDIIDYVVVHELSHLRELNHSERFWNIVGSILPDYADRRQRLKQHAQPRWD